MQCGILYSSGLAYLGFNEGISVLETHSYSLIGDLPIDGLVNHIEKLPYPDGRIIIDSSQGKLQLFNPDTLQIECTLKIDTNGFTQIQ